MPATGVFVQRSSRSQVCTAQRRGETPTPGRRLARCTRQRACHRTHHSPAYAPCHAHLPPCVSLPTLVQACLRLTRSVGVEGISRHGPIDDTRDWERRRKDQQTRGGSTYLEVSRGVCQRGGRAWRRSAGPSLCRQHALDLDASARRTQLTRLDDSEASRWKDNNQRDRLLLAARMHPVNVMLRYPSVGPLRAFECVESSCGSQIRAVPVPTRCSGEPRRAHVSPNGA
jgi:hypothetical protein